MLAIYIVTVVVLLIVGGLSIWMVSSAMSEFDRAVTQFTQRMIHGASQPATVRVVARPEHPPRVRRPEYDHQPEQYMRMMN